MEYAKLDHNQFDIDEIRYFTGNPHLRTSMMLNVTFSHNNITENQMIPYSADIDKTQQFEEFINRIPYLFPLRFHAAQAKAEVRRIRKEVITRIVPGDTVYLDLRFFDGENSAWFDSLDLPEKEKSYYVQIRIRKWLNNRRIKAEAFCQTFNCTIFLNNYDVRTVILTEEEFREGRDILITEAHRQIYPLIFQA